MIRERHWIPDQVGDDRKRQEVPWILSLLRSPIRSGTSVGNDREGKTGMTEEEKQIPRYARNDQFEVFSYR